MILNRGLLQATKAPLIQNAPASKPLGEEQVTLLRCFLELIDDYWTSSQLGTCKTILVWTFYLFTYQPDTFQYICIPTWYVSIHLTLCISAIATRVWCSTHRQIAKTENIWREYFLQENQVAEGRGAVLESPPNSNCRLPCTFEFI